MGTKSNPGDFDCYAKAEPDEPIFVLLGRDRHAPTLIWLWAAMRELEECGPGEPERSDEEKAIAKRKVNEARDLVTAMIDWQVAHGRKAVGLAQATLTGMMDLVRVANMRVDDLIASGASGKPGNVSSEEVLRALLCRFRPAVEGGEDPKGL